MTRISRSMFALAAALGLFAGVARARGPATLPATKVGVVDVGMIFSKYKKADAYRKALEVEIAPLKKQGDELKATMKAHDDWLKVNAAKDPVQAEKSRDALRQGQRALEDLQTQAGKIVIAKQQTQVIEVYREIQAAIQTYGQQNGFHTIIAIAEPPPALTGDPLSAQHVERKMNALDFGGSFPLYVQPGLDVTQDVLARLNAASATK